MNRLQSLGNRGQRIWLDEIRRDLIASGRLESMLVECAISGFTSNPTIFASAVQGSPVYDSQIRELDHSGAATSTIYAEIVTRDMQAGCDVLRPTWQRSNGDDGYGSVEVSPHLAHDTEATIAEAVAWVGRISRPNLMVKVPATAAGISAIESLTAGGVNVNVTLLFGLDRYEQVINAYLRGVERLVDSGGDVSGVLSVASFFVSRVDVEVESRLTKYVESAPARRDTAKRLEGTVGIANARAAYGMYRRAFSGPRWERLAAAGARPQRVLWASTSVKNDQYRDTMYLEELFQPGTVNTMPRSVLKAFQDHGDPGIEPFSNSDIHISYDDVVAVLEREGIEKFAASFDALMRLLESKRTDL
ncbi:MAG: transaldolase [Deltaproteobacteria bacterium]|nr:transaldolase [Deltaproteobacteria bacterium]